MIDVPTEYNELVELIENNDPSVSARVIQENFTANEKLEELVEDWRGMAELAGPEEFVVAYTRAADETEEVIDGNND